MASIAGELREVVVVGANDVASMIEAGPQGVYLVGTGDTGVAGTFAVLGIAYFLVMVLASFSYRLPAPGWLPEGWTPPAETSDVSGARNFSAREMVATVLAVLFEPQPAMTGTLPPATSTAVATRSAHSSSVRVGVSPVVPQGTRPEMPAAICRSHRLR